MSNYYDTDEMYNQDRNDAIADGLENYIDMVNNLCILEGRNKDEIKSSIKRVKKAIKNLRNGHPEKVFDEDRFYEYINQFKHE
jgi:deoxyribose-phosphate aldolase